MSVMDEISVASFFSDAGGLDLGFKSQGFDIIYAPRKYSYPFAEYPH
jgi:site-specific DNA-cytosine methylase